MRGKLTKSVFPSSERAPMCLVCGSICLWRSELMTSTAALKEGETFSSVTERKD